MPRNPFGDDVPDRDARANPFRDDAPDMDPVTRIAHAARAVRNLRAQIGAEGMTATGSRELVSELGAALDAIARALRGLRTAGGAGSGGADVGGAGSPETFE